MNTDTAPSPEAAELGRRIKTAREAKGLSQEDLAGAVGVRSGIVSRWENGRNVPRLKRLAEIADVLDCDVGYFTARLNGSAPPRDGTGLAAIERRLAALERKLDEALGRRRERR